MGRYYWGDIEGKFWFAVQSSDDADYFGVEGHSQVLNYNYDISDLPKVKEGIKDCKSSLGEYKKYLDDFFKGEGSDGYNDGMVSEYLTKKTKKIHTEKGVMFFLQWYARLELGKQIQKCLKDNGECNFEAEL